MGRYLDILDTLYEAIVEDLTREDFIVPDKYKAKQEELGKNILNILQTLIHTSKFVSSSFNYC